MSDALLILLAALTLQGSADEPRRLLERAEEHDRAGRWTDARATYKRLAERFPGTDAGRVAARRSAPSAFLGWDWVVQHGPSANRVDIALLGDGYEVEHLKSWVRLAADIPPLFERQKVFREYWSYLNFVRADLVSAENGVDGFGREYDTALNAQTGRTFAGHVVIDGRRVHAMLSELPEQDGLAICFVKNGVLGTGGGGYATIGGRDATTTVHEWGHAFGWLGDEYDAQQAAHQGGVRDCANVASTPDPTKVPWAHWIAARHPGVGVYEGAAARLKGAWKPTSTGCVMSSGEQFCVVCQEALVLRIHAYVDPIDACSPEPQPQRVSEAYRLGDDPLEFRVKVMQPATHDLEVRWWLLSETRFPHTGGATPSYPARGRAAQRGRTERGPLPPIEEKPYRESLHAESAEHVLKLSARDLEPGRWRVICRAKDTTRLRGERWPWVLKDEQGLLESERTWWIGVPPR